MLFDCYPIDYYVFSDSFVLLEIVIQILDQSVILVQQILIFQVSHLVMCLYVLDMLRESDLFLSMIFLLLDVPILRSVRGVRVRRNEEGISPTEVLELGDLSQH